MDSTNEENNSSTQPSNPIFLRAGAMIIDGIILGIAGAIIAPVLSSLFSFDSLYSLVNNFRLYTIVNSLISCALFLAYFGFLEGKQGQASVGKRLLGFELQREDGGKPSLEQALKHAAPFAAGYLLNILPGVGALLSLALGIYILYTIYQDPENRGWHDRFSGCKVVKLPR